MYITVHNSIFLCVIEDNCVELDFLFTNNNSQSLCVLLTLELQILEGIN